MTESASDIHMEDGDPASNRQRYLPDFDGSYATSGYDGYLAMEQQMSSVEQLHAWYNGPLLASSTSPPVHLAQSWVPDRYLQEFDNDLLSSNMCEVDPSTWLTQALNGPAGNGSTRVHEAISMNSTNDFGLYSQTSTSLLPQDSLPLDMDYDIPYACTLVDLHGCHDPSFDTPYYTLSTSSGSNTYASQINFGDPLVQGISSDSSDSYVMTPVGSTDYERPGLQHRATGSPPQPIDLDPPYNMNSCVSYGSIHAPAPITSSWSAPAAQSTAWTIAHSAPTQALPTPEKPTVSTRKRHLLDGDRNDRSLRDVEQRISKRARVPESSVNILSFRARDDPPKGRGHRSESAKQDMQGLAPVGGSCTHCVYIKKKCDKQLPCAMCAKLWNRYSSRTPPKAKRIDRVSPDKSSDVALQTKRALRQIYDEMTAVRDSALSLPKLMSIIHGLKPTQKRLMQSLLMHIPWTIRQDLGCYFYILMIMGRTQSFQNPSFETRSSRNILDQWHTLEASALLSVRNITHVPELDEDLTFICNISDYIFVLHAPSTASITRQMEGRKNDHFARDVRRFSKICTFPHLSDDLNHVIAWGYKFFPSFIHALKKSYPQLSERLRLFRGIENIENEGWRQLYRTVLKQFLYMDRPQIRVCGDISR